MSQWKPIRLYLIMILLSDFYWIRIVLLYVAAVPILASYLTCVSDDNKARKPKSYIKVMLGCNLEWSNPSEDLFDQDQLQRRLASLGFRAYNILGNGHCQFRAVYNTSIAVTDTASVRRQAVQYSWKWSLSV